MGRGWREKGVLGEGCAKEMEVTRGTGAADAQGSLAVRRPLMESEAPKGDPTHRAGAGGGRGGPGSARTQVSRELR